MQVQTNLKAGAGKKDRLSARLTRQSCGQELDLCAMMASHGHIPSDYLAKCDACLERFPDLAPA